MSEEFLTLLNYLEESEPSYPWDVQGSDVTSEDALVDEEDLQARSSRFFANLDNLFTQKSVGQTVWAQVKTRLSWEQCQEILNVCQTKATAAEDLASRLRLAVQELLPQWSEEDLGLLLRPYSVAFRGTANDQSDVINGLRDKSWDESSPLEQAKYLVAIAHLTLSELESEE